MGSTMDYSFSCSVGSLTTCDTCSDRQTRQHILGSGRVQAWARVQRGSDSTERACGKNPSTCGAYALDQFLVFAVAGREEFHLNKAIQMGLVQKDFRELRKSKAISDVFLTSVQNFKIFVSLRGTRTQRKYFSFYVRLETDPTLPETIIKPFPFSPVKSNFFFRAKLVFLKKKEVLRDVIDPKGESAAHLKRQKMLPVETLKQMIERDYKELRKGVRKLKI